MKHLIAIARKEWSRFFAGRGYALITVFLPGLLLYGMYSMMGAVDFAGGDEDAEVIIAVENMPASFFHVSSLENVSIIDADGLDTSEAGLREAISSGDINAFVQFPPDFDASVAAYDVSSGAAAPNVAIFYDATEDPSYAAFVTVASALEAYEQTLANKFDINADPSRAYNLASEEDASAHYFSMLFPMLIVFLLFSSIVAVAAESLAGEKERGTIATILATPVSRSSLAFGKTLAVSGISLLAAIFTILGLVLGMRNMMGAEVEMASYSMADYGWLALTVISVTALLVVLAIALSGLAKTTKDAQVLSVPAYAVVMVAGMASMLASSAKAAHAWYLIPLYNSMEAMKGIFALEASPVNILVAVAANAAFTLLGLFVLTRMLNSERLMFQR